MAENTTNYSNYNTRNSKYETADEYPNNEEYLRKRSYKNGNSLIKSVPARKVLHHKINFHKSLYIHTYLHQIEIYRDG